LDDTKHVTVTQVQLNTAPWHADITELSLAGNASITFDGYGVPSDGGSIALNVGSFNTIVLINAQTGIASLQ
ncbi:MAG: hypothetical protein MI741_07750, partial [Rhodospirillales bacterium]|nr:hypothetical protein [Rhodospirillales bacterium]